MRATAAAPLRARDAGEDPYALAAAVREFFGRHAEVEVWEGGRCVARIAGERAGYSLSADASRLVCHFWGGDANLVRRVSGASGGGGTRLQLQAWRMGQTQPSALQLQARGAANESTRELAAKRAEFRIAVIAAAERSWAGWRHVRASGGAMLGRTAGQRLLFRRQQALLPCVAVGPEEGYEAAETALAQALLWAEEVAEHWPKAVIQGLRLVIPEAAGGTFRARAEVMRKHPRVEAFIWDRGAGMLEGLGPGVAGAESEMVRAPEGGAMPEEAKAVLARVRTHCPQAYWRTTPVRGGAGGAIAVYGLDVVHRASGAERLVAPFTFGVGAERNPLVASADELCEQMLAAVGRERVPGGNAANALYAAQPERWMEHMLRLDPTLLDARLDRRFVYAQVPACGGGRRDVLDLLAVDRDGRLVVIELKADEQVDVPLQALDYWQRVRKHQWAGDFERLGYFPGVRLSAEAPLLWMVAPALRWHPGTDTLCGWLGAEVPWRRIGINEEWRRGMQVVSVKAAGGV